MRCYRKSLARAALAALISWFGAGGAEPNDGYVVSTIVGGLAPVAPAPASTASIGGIAGFSARPDLHNPAGVAVDAAGNLYIADVHDRRVLKRDASGKITTVAGNGTCCYSGDGGEAVRAQIGGSLNLALDAQGNLYISQANFHRVRRVSVNGTITTVAGTGAAGFAGDGGPANKAQLNQPAGIALDSAGNLYIADRFNHRVRKVAPDGVIRTVAGAGAQGDGRVRAPLSNPASLAVDSEGSLYILDYQVLKVSAAGVMSTVADVLNARALAVDSADALHVASDRAIVWITPQGAAENVTGAEIGAGLSGMAIDMAGRIYVSDRAGNAVLMLTPVEAAPERTDDLKVELRSVTGSNRFRIGEEIPLQVVLSSATLHRYLEPCALFNENSANSPRCRFFTPWAFSIRPAGGWVDLTQEFPSGPTGGSFVSLEVANPDLSSTPKTFSYVLTHRFRFDVPGEYRVRLSMDIGFDDETTRYRSVPDLRVRPHKVSVMREIVLEIIPASPQLQSEIVRRGIEAFSAPMPAASNPPSPEYQKNHDARKALCSLGSAETARALAGLLARNDGNHQEEGTCLQHTASPAAAVAEMERLLVAPDVAVNAGFFGVLTMLRSRDVSRASGLPMLSQQYVDFEREKLLAALPRKSSAARNASLLTVLANPSQTKGNAFESGSAVPFAPPVVAMAAAEFDSFPPPSQDWLLDEAWDTVRSPLMLPVVREHAIAGDGQALLRWRELDPPAATAFIREEVVRANPRFSSFYLRLPETSLPRQEARIAANFVALTGPADLTRAATLLHRYATVAVLPTVLPFIDSKRSVWPCSVQIPVLAYLLKVSPEEAETRFAQTLSEVNQGACRTNTLFSDIGFLESGPVLDRLALAEIDKGVRSQAIDAAGYLRQYGSAAAKPLLFEKLVEWRRAYLDSGAEKRWPDRAATNDDAALRALVQALAEAFGRAQAWLLTTQESRDLQALLGSDITGGISCIFSCGASLGTGGAPARYAIYGHVNQRFQRKPAPMEYLNPADRLRYAINQYRCDSMQALKEKILQFPKGSTFDFAYEFTAADREETSEIGAFLHSHGYRIGETHGWSFLRPDPRE